MTEAPGAVAPFVERDQQREAARLGMWAFLATEVMFFGALFVVYFYDHRLYPAAFASAGGRTELGLGALNTAVLLVSSLTMALAVQAAKDGRARALFSRLIMTLALGAVFLALKGLEYARHIHDHLLPGPSFLYAPAALARPAELFFYLYFTMTGLHALHMIVGLAWLTALAVRVRRGRSADHFTRVEVAGLYWHFIDVVWIFLFPMFYLVRGALMETARKEGRLYRVAAALLALLALTVGLSFVDLGRYNFAAALAVAGAKALLVLYYFMELGEGVDAVRFLAAAGFVWLGLLLAGTFADLLTR